MRRQEEKRMIEGGAVRMRELGGGMKQISFMSIGQGKKELKCERFLKEMAAVISEP
jgi:hypothetical protein